MKESEQNFTVGKVSEQLFKFTVPLFFANLLQAGYNIADMVVVGRYVGSSGLAAVSNASMLCFIITSIGIGITVGGTVLAARARGGGDRTAERATIGTLFAVTALAALPVTAGGWWFSRSVFLLMKVPEEALEQACGYMNILSDGTLCVFGYNAVCALLRGLGDSRRPLLFVAIAAAVNIMLDLLLVGVWKLGVTGAAWATVTAQAAALLAGAVWGFLPAFFKAKWNTNETLFTLMMNYIAMQLASYFIIIWEVPKGAGKIGIINQASEAGWLPRIGGQAQLLPILVVALLTGMMYVYLTYSKHGYEIAVVGESQRTASYAGIKVDRVIIRTMVLSGAICGLMGYILTAGISHTLTTTIVDSRGFTAVMVSWMSKFNPFIMIAASLLLVTMDRGAGEISTAFSLNQSFADILTGIILFFIIATEFFITYKVSLRKNSKKEA